MTEAEMFREKAAQCDRLAEAAFTEPAREALKRQAKDCRRQAEQLERVARQEQAPRRI